VKFIKDTIDTWQISSATGLPPGVTLPNPALSIYAFAPGTKVGVWQAISTRNGGEVVSADQY
jgi:hypothetical protein